MSNSTDTTGCISHRRNNRFFIMFEDFLDVAKVSEHHYKLAAFWRVLETKTNDRVTSIPEIAEDCKKKGAPIPEEHLWVEIPYSEFVNRALGVYKSSSFQIAAAESERLGFSKSRQLKRPANPNDPNSPMEDYKEYLFLTDVMQSVLNGGDYPTPIEINSPLLFSIAARKKAKKEKRAIENNTPPIEINSPSTETPIEINSPPLLKSIGNKDISKDDKNERRIVSDSASENSNQDDSLLPSSTPSLTSLQEKPSMPDLPSKEKTDRDTEPLKPSGPFLPEQERMDGYWQQLGYLSRPSAKEHWTTLSKHINIFEQFKSLFDYTWAKIKNDPKILDKEVHPGNMVKCLDGWKQEQARVEQAKKKVTPLSRPKTLQEMDGSEKAKYYEQMYAKKPTTVISEERA